MIDASLTVPESPRSFLVDRVDPNRPRTRATSSGIAGAERDERPVKIKNGDGSRTFAGDPSDLGAEFTSGRCRL
jgi:hypothetical protein